MTKRDAGKFERNERDFYATPEEPIWKLLPELQGVTTFAEPMCGDGAIVKTLEARGWECAWISDMEPLDDMIARANMACEVDLVTDGDLMDCDVIISNPPWPLPPNKLNGAEPGSPTVPIIRHLMAIKPTWFLLSSDFMHNRYFEDLAPFCHKTVSVGRVSWQGNGKKGFDNAVWYLFDASHENPNPWFRPNTTPSKAYHPSIEDML